MVSLRGILGLTVLCHAECIADETCSTGFSMLQVATDTAAGLSDRHTDVKNHREARQVYIDMGANWANTLRLYKDLPFFLRAASRTSSHASALHKDMTEVQHHHGRGHWEVYAFEAHPLIQPYLEKFVEYLNGEREKPALTVPPSGSTAHLQSYARQYGCFMNELDAMRSCMVHAFQYQLNALKADPQLNSTELVRERLAFAAKPLPAEAKKDRFTFIPAAVGAQDGWLHFRSVDAVKSIFGGAVSDGRSTEQEADVIAADTVSWMVNNFREDDYVVLKMDVEGAEFGILHGLYKANKLPLIDVLAYECHAWVTDGPPPMQTCADLTKVLDSEHIMALVEGSGYTPYDSESSPDKYYPVDPIVRSAVQDA